MTERLRCPVCGIPTIMQPAAGVVLSEDEYTCDWCFAAADPDPDYDDQGNLKAGCDHGQH